MTRTGPFTGTCHCGAVKITIPHQPDYMHDCNCSWCLKQGAIWGYFEEPEVTVSGETNSYTRADYDNPAVRCHFCPSCGCTTHWRLTKRYAAESGSTRMGVNMRMFGEDAKTGVELRFPDGANWTGEEEYGYRRAAVIWSAADNQTA